MEILETDVLEVLDLTFRDGHALGAQQLLFLSLAPSHPRVPAGPPVGIDHPVTWDLERSVTVRREHPAHGPGGSFVAQGPGDGPIGADLPLGDLYRQLEDLEIQVVVLQMEIAIEAHGRSRTPYLSQFTRSSAFLRLRARGRLVRKAQRQADGDRPIGRQTDVLGHLGRVERPYPAGAQTFLDRRQT